MRFFLSSNKLKECCGNILVTVHDPTAFVMGGVAGHCGLFSTIGDVCRVRQHKLPEAKSLCKK
jgi:hypothetical protein